LTDFNWVDSRVYYEWVGSYFYRSLRDFDGYTLPQRTPATLPFLPAEYQSHPATMNPWLSVWVFKRYLMYQRIVVEPMAGVGGTGM